MKKYANIRFNNQKRWVEFCNDDIYLMSGDPLNEIFRREEIIDIDIKKINYLPPSNPSKVIGVGWNYKDLVGPKDSYPEPIVFIKSPTSICAHNSKVNYPKIAEKVWVETELAIVIGKECSNINSSEAGSYILGYTIGSDITALNVLERDWHLARSKAFDNFAPIGPFLTTEINTENLILKSRINGREVQNGNTSSRIMDDFKLIELISGIMTLKPGDIILTGTPAGATDAIVVAGDKVEHEVENLGQLSFEII